jgi:hypothetical protein
MVFKLKKGDGELETLAYALSVSCQCRKRVKRRFLASVWCFAFCPCAAGLWDRKNDRTSYCLNLAYLRGDPKMADDAILSYPTKMSWRQARNAAGKRK